MDFNTFFHSQLFVWVILPILIFCSRILDVSFDTVRIIFVSRGKKTIAPLLGFCSVLLWIIVIAQVMRHLDNWICYVAYAAGFATGNFVGMTIEEKLAIGVSVVRIFLVKDDGNIRQKLIDAGFGTTEISAQGSNGDVKVVFTVVMRKYLPKVLEIIRTVNPNAFYCVEEAKNVNMGIFPEFRRSTER